MKPEAFTGTYQGEPAVWLKAGRYEAAVLPGVGANLIAFRDVQNGYRFIREPEQDEMKAFKAVPMAHGIPVLFPPNRYDDGKFQVRDVHYQFPINEPETGNHLHGICLDQPWETVDSGADDQASFASFAFTLTESDAAYASFPHCFKITLRYTLSDEGLEQHVTVHNMDDKPMPCMLGFHTAINAPFVPGSSSDDYVFSTTIGERWELDERMLPTERTSSLSTFEESFKDETKGASPYFEEMDNHYSAEPGVDGNRMVLTDRREQVRLIYDVGLGYKQWMIWNNSATVGFFCPEPQINMVNAPNLSLSAEKTGLVVLQPGESWSEQSRLYAERVG